MTDAQINKICDRIEGLTFADLQHANSTLRDMYYLNQILMVGYGLGPDDLHETTLEFALKFLQKAGK
jgi:hypothetical protein